jgi:hypothetical protein
MEAFITGVVAGYGIAIPVGAIAILIVEVGLKHGFRPAFFAGAGAARPTCSMPGSPLSGGRHWPMPSRPSTTRCGSQAG